VWQVCRDRDGVGEGAEFVRLRSVDVVPRSEKMQEDGFGLESALEIHRVISIRRQKIVRLLDGCCRPDLCRFLSAQRRVRSDPSLSVQADRLLVERSGEDLCPIEFDESLPVGRLVMGLRSLERRSDIVTLTSHLRHNVRVLLAHRIIIYRRLDARANDVHFWPDMFTIS